MQYIVICLDDEGRYVQGTRCRMSKRQADKRAEGIAPSRRPVVVEVPAVALDEEGYPLRDEEGRMEDWS
jgi:hypothetical protein